METVAVPPYNKNVLIGNWVERRYSQDGKSNGILPGLFLSDNCEMHRSLSQDTYTNKTLKSEDFDLYLKEKRIIRMRNFKAGTTSNVKFFDNTEATNNYTTTNTLVYEILPELRKEMCLRRTAPKIDDPPEQKADMDLLKSFGNLTKTYNFAKQFKSLKRQEDLTRMKTIYSTSYNHPQRSR